MATTILIYSLEPAANIEIVIPSGNPIIGESYASLCNVTVFDSLQGDVIVQWIDPSGLTLMSITTSESTSLPLSFNPLVAADVGNYTCRAIIASSLMDGSYVIEEVLNLNPTRDTGIRLRELVSD